jgi:hypothetical protein
MNVIPEAVIVLPSPYVITKLVDPVRLPPVTEIVVVPNGVIVPVPVNA